MKPVDQSARFVYETPFIRLTEEDFHYPDGSEGTFTFVSKPDFAVIIPFDDNGFHLVEQYRYPIKRRSLEFPQGAFPNLQEGDPEALARAELREETGFTAGTMTHLAHLFAAPGMASQGFDVFLASDLTAGQHRREATEQDMTQRWVSEEEFLLLLQDGTIMDAATIAAYGHFLLHRRLTS